MIKLKLAQHIYGNVEKADSPTKVGGFQTLFYSREVLTSGDVEEMEGKLIYYLSEVNPLKRLFFPLESGGFVLGRVVPLTDDRDKFGREGTYLGHCVVVSAVDFERIGLNPFVLFPVLEELFCGRLEEAVQRGDVSGGDIGILEVEIDEGAADAALAEAVELAKAWDGDRLKGLVYHGIHNITEAGKGEALVLVGNIAGIMEALEVVWLFLRGVERRVGSFDTHFKDCNLVHGGFWAVGYPELGDAPSRLPVVNVDTRRVDRGIEGALSLYLQWMFGLMDGGRFAEIAQTAEVAYNMCKMMEDDGGLWEADVVRRGLDTLSVSVLQGLMQVLRGPLEQWFQGTLTQMVGEELGLRLAPAFTARNIMDDEPAALLAKRLEGVTFGDLMERLYLDFKENFQVKPEKTQFKELTKLLKSRSFPKLSLLVNLWEEEDRELLALLAADGECLAEFLQFLPKLANDRVKDLYKEVKGDESKYPSELVERLAALHLEMFGPEKEGGFFKKLLGKFGKD